VRLIVALGSIVIQEEVAKERVFSTWEEGVQT
jgi:hypothetical protein